MDDQHNLTATDEVIDRRLEQLLAVDPAPEFLARVRMQVASDEPIAARSSRALIAIAASALVVAVTLWVNFTPSERPEVLTTIQTPQPPVEESLPDVLPSTVAKPMNVDVKVHTFKPLPAKSATAPMPEVLISPLEVAAFDQFLTSARERRFEVSADAITRLTDMGPRGDLTIVPLAIDTLSPIEPLVASEGVNQ